MSGVHISHLQDKYFWLFMVSATFINENYTEVSSSSCFYQVTQMSWHATQIVLRDYNYNKIYHAILLTNENERTCGLKNEN